MGKSKYGVLIGKVEGIEADPSQEKTPHYRVYVRIKGKEKYRVNINCKSRRDKNPQVLYVVKENIETDIYNKLTELNSGFHEIDYNTDINSEIAIDYQRSSLIELDEMNHLPFDIAGENDLKGSIDHNMKKALNNEQAVIYVFGTYYNNDDGIKGIHNVHMNQGNRGTHYEENEIYHDGCLFIHFIEEEKWIAYFFAFQSQSWNTDDKGRPKD